jgi:hypothetical protein
MNDTSLQKISGDYAHHAFQVQNTEDENLSLRDNATSVPDDEEGTGAGAEFGGRYGPGVKLKSANITGKPKS